MEASNLSLTALFGVEGKVVVVTGGGTGIGRAITTGFAQNGAKIYIIGRRKEVIEKTAEEINSEIKKSGGKGQVIAIQGDVSSKATIKAFKDQIAELETKIDTLVNCAGILIPFHKKAEDTSSAEQLQEQFESVVDDDFALQNAINVAGPYFTTIAFAPMLVKSDLPSVIVIASIGAFSLGTKVGSMTYGISKGGTVTVAQQLAARLIHHGIRVNCICPGIYPTEMTGDGASLAPHIEAIIDTIPAKRAGSAVDIAGPCIMLASAAGSYMNNALLVIDGGRLMSLSTNS